LELAGQPDVAGLAFLTDQADVDPHHLSLRRDVLPLDLTEHPATIRGTAARRRRGRARADRLDAVELLGVGQPLAGRLHLERPGLTAIEDDPELLDRLLATGQIGNGD